MRTLIVDDNAINRLILQEFILPFGECDMAEDGAAAVSMFAQALESGNDYDLICMDICMPEMDGHTALSAIRDLERSAKVPAERCAKALVVSVYSDRENVLKSFSLCQGYLKKPVNRQNLAEKLAILGFFPKAVELSGTNWRQNPYPVTNPSVHNVLDSKDMDEDIPDSSYLALPLIRIENGVFQVYVHHSTEDGTLSEEESVPVPFENLSQWLNVREGEFVARYEMDNPASLVGQNLRIAKRRPLLIATKSGRLACRDGKVELQHTVRLDGVVANRDVEFVGRLEINGDIRDGVRIRGDEEVVIHGDVGNACIESRGDVRFRRMYGKRVGYARAGRDFHAECVYESKVEADGNLNIAVETVNSVLKAAGIIHCAGTLTGGETLAGLRLDVIRLGSPKDVGTRCRIGEDFRILDKRAEIELRMVEIEQAIQRIEHMLGPYAEDLGKVLILPDEKKPRVYQLAAERHTLLKRKQELSVLCSTAESDNIVNHGAEVIVRDKLYPGIHLQIGGISRLFDAPIEGPIRIIPDFVVGDFRIEPFAI